MFVETKKEEGLENPIHGLVNKEHGKYHIVLVIFSIFILSALFISTLIGTSSFTKVQYGIAYLFLGDFIYRFITATDKLNYLKTGWIDLMLCLPFYSPTWMVVATTLRSLKAILEFVLIKINNAFTSMLILGAALVTFSTISILQFETVENSSIKTAWDAVWWSICTITTVGYGDKFPVTDGGKIVAIILMVCGIGLFGTLIGYFSSFFTDKEKKNNNTVDTIEELSQQITELRNELKKQNEISN